MATIALIAEKNVGKKYDPDSTCVPLSTGGRLAELCRTDPSDPKTADFDRLFFLLMDSHPALDTLHTITAGVSSTWNPQPPQMRVIYTQVGMEIYDCREIVRVAIETARDKSIVVIIGCLKSLQEMLIVMSSQSKFSDASRRLVSSGFLPLPGDMAMFDADSVYVSLFEP